MREVERRFVEAMLEKASKSHKIQEESKVDIAEVQKLTENIQRRLQKGESARNK